MQKRFYILIFIAALSVSFRTTPNHLTHELAFSLNNGGNSGIVTFAVLQRVNGRVLRSDIVSKQSFMLIASGEQISSANEKPVNMLEENGIENYIVEVDSIDNNYVYDFGTVGNIWKLRYKTYPYQDSTYNEAGWGNGRNMPSPGQEAILKQYGVSWYKDFFIGKKAFQLLKDMEDPNWVSTYKAS